MSYIYVDFVRFYIFILMREVNDSVKKYFFPEDESMKIKDSQYLLLI